MIVTVCGLSFFHVFNPFLFLLLNCSRSKWKRIQDLLPPEIFFSFSTPRRKHAIPCEAFRVTKTEKSLCVRYADSWLRRTCRATRSYRSDARGTRRFARAPVRHSHSDLLFPKTLRWLVLGRTNAKFPQKILNTTKY